MSTNPETIAPSWASRAVVTFNGARDSHIETGEDYATITLAQIFAMEPDAKPKLAAPAFLPSEYHDYDARSHAAQRDKGSFVALVADIDHGNPSPRAVQTAIKAFAPDTAHLIYSSASSSATDRRWRAIVPLDQPCDFGAWLDAQTAFFAFMAAKGIQCDHALARAGQPVYLPNVPADKRDDQGHPLYYQRGVTSLALPGLSLTEGEVAAGIAALRIKRAEDETERARIRKEAEQRRANAPRRDGASIIDDFNAANSVATMIEICGYEQSPVNGDDYRSPLQSGETYATRIFGSKWISLSESDTSAGLGSKHGAGCYGDAYDLYAHYKHGGDHKAAYRALHAEQRGANVVPFPTPPVPEWMTEAPLPDAVAEWAEFEPDIEGVDAGDFEVAFDGPHEPDALPLVIPADWTGTRAPDRVWRWDSFVPDMQATLLTGAGAAGKSLAMQQMSTCVALGLPFLGIPTRQANSIYITCEDDNDELQRRQESICEMLGVPLEATRGRLFLLSLAGAIGNELAVFSPDGSIEIAPRYHEIEAACHAHNIAHATIDNTAHTFSGNENDRHHVAAYVNLNIKLAKSIGGSVVMVGHPNKSGDSYSGSTAWENQVRSRLYLEVPKGCDDTTPIDPDMRVLRNEKANYSQRGSEVRFWWCKGAFVIEEQMPDQRDDGRENAAAAYENDLFLTLLDKLTEQRRHVSHAANLSNYAPKVMALMPEARGLSKANFARAMERLFLIEKVVASQALWNGRDRHPVLGLARKRA